MIFPSYVFLLVFLPLVLAFWLSRLPLRARLVGLTIASYFFYGWWDYRFTLLMAASTFLDYFCARGIYEHDDDEPRRRQLLALSLSGNLGLLGFFKYCDFFLSSADRMLSILGLEAHLPLLHIVLPIGISFYTFQSMSYSLDVYRRNAKPAPDLLHFAAYVSLFPQLVAGPIVRYEAMAAQISALRDSRVSASQLGYGTFLFIIGLGKKLLIADRLASAANQLFDTSVPIAFGYAWWGSLSYTFQLYFDFSGYSDMAIGLGLMLGFRFPINFNSPYKSRNPSDFWRRWHMTLSGFLRDYLYIPLGGNRMGVARTLRNLVVTMGLGGLWHGAKWTFVVWGLYHGLLLMAHATGERMKLRPWPSWLAVACTFLAVHLGWVLFRAPNFTRALDIYRGLFGLAGFEESLLLTYQSGLLGTLPRFILDLGGLPAIYALPCAAAVAFLAPVSHSIRNWSSPIYALFTAVIAIACLFSLSAETPFLYFQF